MKHIMCSKKNIVILLVILAAIIAAVIYISIKSNEVIPENRFGITKADLFCLNSLFTVNGAEAYTKTDFTDKEKQQILYFLASLDNEKTIKDPPEMMFGVPVMLGVSTQDGKSVFFLHRASNIEVEQSDKDGKLLSRKTYTTTIDQMKTIYTIYGLPAKDVVD